MNPKDLGRLKFQPKSGNEIFHLNGEGLGIDLISFWRWSSSDLVSNATRGVLAEFIVAKALDITLPSVRSEWDAYDLETDSGIKIEVKSAAYIQSWHQDKLSSINFRVHRKLTWDADTNRCESEAKRPADVYVFALLAHQDKTTIDPLNLNQWMFYVMPSKLLNRRQTSQRTITLKSLEKQCGEPVHFLELKAKVTQAQQVNLSMK